MALLQESDDDGPPAEHLTPAEVRMRREALGVSVSWLAARLAVRERTWERWETGASTPPPGLDTDLRTVEVAADALVDELTAWAAAHPGEPLTTYRWDHQVPAEVPWPAQAHRMACAAAAAAVDDLRVVFAPDVL